MVKGDSLRRRGTSSTETNSNASYDYLKEIVKMAKKNGWEMGVLGLVPRDLPELTGALLTKKEFQDRNKYVKNVLKRFSEFLTPPVPLDLEKSIRRGTRDRWLPWEAEAIEKVDAWREEVKRIRPEILKALSSIGQSTLRSGSEEPTTST